jgi:hypothetical protein
VEVFDWQESSIWPNDAETFQRHFDQIFICVRRALRADARDDAPLGVLAMRRDKHKSGRCREVTAKLRVAIEAERPQSAIEGGDEPFTDGALTVRVRGAVETN